jgi:hypothetical protein
VWERQESFEFHFLNRSSSLKRYRPNARTWMATTVRSRPFLKRRCV